MPQRSERAKIVEDLENRLVVRVISNSMEMVGSFTNSDEGSNSSPIYDSDEDLLMDGVSTIYNSIMSHRYFSKRNHGKVNSSCMANDLLHINSLRFKARFMMSPEAFTRIWSMIEDHNIFYNKSGVLQFDPCLQFLVVLFKFGVYGNGASRSNIATSFHISTGEILKFTKRVMVAILSLEKSVLCWPTNTKKQIIKDCIEESHGFPDVIGIMDGTHIVLATKPSYQGEWYFNRKSRYSISCMIVNDQNCRITHLQAGFLGSAHDSWVFLNSQLWLKHDDFFKGDEYLLTNSGYSLKSITLPPYKQPASKKRENKQFNKHLSSIRVKSKHTIEHLKGRFQSLRGMPTVISNKKTHTLVVLWIRCCAVLHNLLLEDGYDSNWGHETEDPDRIVSDDNVDGANQALPYNDVVAKYKRENIKAQVLHYHGD